MSEDKNTKTETDEKGSEDTPETPKKENDQNETETAETTKAEEASIEDEFAQLKAEYENRYDRMLRTIAEYENSKKRAEREKEEFLKYAIEGFVKDLIPVMDSIDSAIASTNESKDFDALSEGVQLIYKQLLDALERRGVTPIEAVGETFDPTQHEAIMHVESDDVPENAVIQDFQRGYMLHNRVVRPSMVSVSKGSVKKKEETPPVSEDKNDASSNSGIKEEKEETDNE